MGQYGTLMFFNSRFVIFEKLCQSFLSSKTAVVIMNARARSVGRGKLCLHKQCTKHSLTASRIRGCKNLRLHKRSGKICSCFTF